ncbi:MAG: EscT/YscT/HrcT family type III secretion system export apparatus protein [Myxococcota bacterium]
MEGVIAWLGGAQEVNRALVIGTLVAARVAPVTVLAPWIVLRDAPAAVRLAIMAVLTVALAPLALASAPETTPRGAPLFLLGFREAIVGTTFALATALPLHALEWAGRLIDTWRGATLAEVIAPSSGERSSPTGLLYLLLGVALFAVLGGHRLAIAAFAEGLAVAPVGVVTLGTSVSDVAFGAARLSASAIGFALAIAAPVGVTLLAVEASLGLMARAAPKVPAFFAGMPLRAAVGIGALLLASSYAVARFPAVFRDAVDAGLSLMRALG